MAHYSVIHFNSEVLTAFGLRFDDLDGVCRDENFVTFKKICIFAFSFE
jgi:hypothetical protein